MADQADKIPESLPVTSSVPAELPEKQEALAREVLVALERQRIPYAVAGAHALLEHTGICRTTKDLDLFLTSENGMSNAVFSVDDSSIRNSQPASVFGIQTRVLAPEEIACVQALCNQA